MEYQARQSDSDILEDISYNASKPHDESSTTDNNKSIISSDVDSDSPMVMSYREHGVSHPLSRMLDMIPTSVRRPTGSLLLTSQRAVRLTCIYAVEDYLAVGSDVGILYLYTRFGYRKQQLQRLNARDGSECILCVSIASTLELLVAFGTNKGCVYIYKLPSELPGRSKQLENVILGNIHSSGSRVICCTWSKNGERLFSGDSMGLICCTLNMDYTRASRTNSSEGVWSSHEVARESSGITQLSYDHRYLLVSTAQRSVIININTNVTNAPITLQQIGTKPRKIIAPFGCHFNPISDPQLQPFIYCSRPGLRLWKSDVKGTVMKTIMFTDNHLSEHPVITLVNNEEMNQSESTYHNSDQPEKRLSASQLAPPLMSQSVIGMPKEVSNKLTNTPNLMSQSVSTLPVIDQSKRSPQFGRILFVDDNVLVTWSDRSLYIVNVVSGEILSRCRELAFAIVDVTCWSPSGHARGHTFPEVLVLFANRSVARISTQPEPKWESRPPPVMFRGRTSLSAITSLLSGPPPTTATGTQSAGRVMGSLGSKIRSINIFGTKTQSPVPLQPAPELSITQQIETERSLKQFEPPTPPAVLPEVVTLSLDDVPPLEIESSHSQLSLEKLQVDSEPSYSGSNHNISNMTRSLSVNQHKLAYDTITLRKISDKQFDSDILFEPSKKKKRKKKTGRVLTWI